MDQKRNDLFSLVQELVGFIVTYHIKSFKIVLIEPGDGKTYPANDLADQKSSLVLISWTNRLRNGRDFNRDRGFGVFRVPRSVQTRV